jgi:two-component system LytT family response regulator
VARLRTVIVDDERLARARLQRLLLAEPDVELVGQCRSAHEARAVIAEAAPALLFVDVEMPRGDGFALLAGLAPPPAVVFVTAFEHHAVRAFEVSACDYLVKPVAAARLKLAVQRARDLVAGRAPAHPTADPGAVLVHGRGRVLRIALDAIDWIEAAGNYVQLHVDREVHLVRETITAFEARLAPSQFARIHRTALVNLARVAAFEPTASGDFAVALRDGTRLRLSRTYRDRIRDVFGNAI